MSKDGGPAFPSGWPYDTVGMSLRDYFAAQVIQALFDSPHWRDATIMLNDPEKLKKVFALRAYDIADAMLAARDSEKPSSHDITYGG